MSSYNRTYFCLLISLMQLFEWCHSVAVRTPGSSHLVVQLSPGPWAETAYGQGIPEFSNALYWKWHTSSPPAFLFQFFTDAQQITSKLNWLTTVTTFVLNLQFGQGSVGTACFCSVWCLLGWLAGWGPQLLATSPPLLQASIHGTSAVAVARACTLETSTWLPGCCTAWFLGSHGEGLKRTGQRLPFMTWFAKPHGPPRQKGEDLDPTTWYRSAASHTVRHETRVLLMWLSTDYTSAATPFVRTSLLRTSGCQVSLGNTAGARQPLQSDSDGRKALLGCSKLATCNFFMSWMGPL